MGKTSLASLIAIKTLPIWMLAAKICGILWSKRMRTEIAVRLNSLHFLAVTPNINLSQRQPRTQGHKNKRSIIQHPSPKKCNESVFLVSLSSMKENTPEWLSLSCWLFKETNKKQLLIHKIDIYEVEIIYAMVFGNHLVASWSKWVFHVLNVHISWSYQRMLI